MATGAHHNTALAEASVDGVIGSLLGGRYRILERACEGGMGDLYVAEHVGLERRVAVKMLPPRVVRDVAFRARFHAEAEIMSQLQHPHIVQVVDYDRTPEGTPYLVMELLRGETLAARLARQVVFSRAETARVVTQIASGLTAVHGAGVVHRDLKPANVFLMDLPDQLPFVKLLDFGISKRLHGSRRVTAVHDLIGTPAYMAPEQARGDNEALDARTDQYALAVMAFEMLTGVRPFESDRLATLVCEIIHGKPPRLSDLNPLLPAAADAVLQRALSKDRGDRFANVLDLAEALSAALHEAHSVSLPPANSGVRLRCSGDEAGPEAITIEIEEARDATKPGQRQAATGVEVALERATRAVASTAETLPAGARDAAPDLAEAGLDGRSELRLLRAPVAGDPDVSPAIAFIASRLELGVMAVSELLDVLPIPRGEAVLTLGEMLDHGMIELV